MESREEKLSEVKFFFTHIFLNVQIKPYYIPKIYHFA